MAELQNLKKHEMFLSLKKDLALVDALKKKKIIAFHFIIINNILFIQILTLFLHLQNSRPPRRLTRPRNWLIKPSMKRKKRNSNAILPKRHRPKLTKN